MHLAPDATQARATAHDLGEVDLLVTGIVLAHGIDGLELAREMLANDSTRVILTTGYVGDVGKRLTGLGDRARLLTKPIARAELIRTAEELFDIDNGARINH